MVETCRWLSTIAARVYAGLVFLCGLAFAFLALVFFRSMHLMQEAVYPLVPALALVVLSAFIWREALWAMSVVAAFAVGLAAFVLEDNPGPVALWAVPAVFAVITVVSIACRIKSRGAGG